VGLRPHLYDNRVFNNNAGLLEIETYAIPEAFDPAFAVGFGDLSVHEVATHPTAWASAYLAYNAGGLRAIEIQCTDPTAPGSCALVETGGYLDPQGNDFLGVEAFVKDGKTYVLGSDRERGLWVFRDMSLSS
jgi:hypothetical protein